MTGIWQRITGRRPRGLTCVELAELVSDYLEGALSAADRERVEGHLAACENCTNYVAQMRVTLELAGKIEPDDLSDEAKAELLEAFRDWARG